MNFRSTIRKIIPFSLYDIPGLEQWLEGQANQGLFPTHLGSWATFEDRGVPGTRFRLDPFANRAGEGLEPTQEKLELYRQAGWEYAFRVGRAYFLFYTTDPHTPELFSDYQSQGLSLDRLANSLRSYHRRKIVLWSLLGILFLAALFLGLVGWYPAVKPALDTLPGPVRRLAKGACFGVALLAVYAALLALMGLEALGLGPAWENLLLWLMGVGTLALYDMALLRLAPGLERRLRHILPHS